jgi:hypothetical protein
MLVLNGTNRLAARAAIATSVAWSLQGLISVVLPDPWAGLDLTMIVPMTLTFFAILGLHLLRFTGPGRLGTIAVSTFGVATAAAIPGQFAMAFEIEALEWFAFPVSAIAFVGGLVLVGVAILRARVAPRWIGGALIAAQPITMAIGLALSPISPLVDNGDYTGALGHGIVWALIGSALLGKRIPIFNVQTTAASATAKP